MAIRPPLNYRPSQPPPAEPEPELEQPSPPRKRGGYRSPSRIGKRAAVAWLEPESVKQLNMMAIQRDTEVQKLLVEAINDFFAKNGLPRFDEV
jgi:hypothetical protein